MANVFKRYALIDKTTGQWDTPGWYQLEWDDEGAEPPQTGAVDLTARTDLIDEHVSDGDLSGLTEDQFKAQKKAVVSGQVFQSWAARAAKPTMTLNGGINPTNDGITKATGTRGFHDFTDEISVTL